MFSAAPNPRLNRVADYLVQHFFFDRNREFNAKFDGVDYFHLTKYSFAVQFRITHFTNNQTFLHPNARVHEVPQGLNQDPVRSFAKRLFLSDRKHDQRAS